MKVERIERVVLDVKNLQAAVEFFTDLLGLEWEPRVAPESLKITNTLTEHANPALENATPLFALSTIGLELMERIPPVEKEGFRALILRVSNLEEAKARMKARGVRLLKEMQVGSLKRAIYHPDDCYGVRLTLDEYGASSHLEAIGQK